jgi:hemolysin activation/secretion protein
VEGAAALTTLEVEQALAPFLGPGRPLEDVEAARAALERRYQARGFQTVSVAVPPQTVRGGVVRLQVTEGRVEHLRVRGSHYFSLREIKRLAPSVAEGQLPDFNALVKDILKLNQWPDRRVTPAIRGGALPGAIDVDLQVEDTLPLHGSLEYNNRASTGTTASRLNAALRYDNLWQAGHSLALVAQIAPERLADGQVYSGAYTARFADLPWLTCSLSALLQGSDVSTLGSVAVRGRGQVYGERTSFTLPGSTEAFFHSLVLGIDLKSFHETSGATASLTSTPVHYLPLTLQYGASWSSEAAQTSLGLTGVANLRGPSSPEVYFDAKRYGASGGFAYARLEASRTQEAWGGFQAWARLTGQLASDPLVASEQLVAGGSDSVRGYLEGAAAGDDGAFGTLELRSPPLWASAAPQRLRDLRVLAFVDGARLSLRAPLPEQIAFFHLWSAGGGTRLRLFDRVTGAIDVAVPLASVVGTRPGHVRVHLRFTTEF